MGERIALAWSEQEGLGIRADSAGVSDEERDNPIDPRAARILRAHGYDPGAHRAKLVTSALVGASSLVLGFEPQHLRMLRRIVPDATNLRLVTDFDPSAKPGSGIPDPWYGGPADFEETLAAIEAAMPGILAEVRGADDDLAGRAG